MKNEIKSITIGYDISGRGEDATDLLRGQTLRIITSEGAELLIELFERHPPGMICIRSDNLFLKPNAGNSVQVGG